VANVRIIEQRCNGKDFEESGRGLIEELPRNFVHELHELKYRN
jgi:hypothetical protein